MSAPREPRTLEESGQKSKDQRKYESRQQNRGEREKDEAAPRLGEVGLPVPPSDGLTSSWTGREILQPLHRSEPVTPAQEEQPLTGGAYWFQMFVKEGKVSLKVTASLRRRRISDFPTSMRQKTDENCARATK